MYKVIIYEDKNGYSEIKEYLKKLQESDSKDFRIKSNKIISYIRKLEENGLYLNKKYIKHIQKEIWELRPLRDRILFASIQNDTFILLSIFMKRTNKTPKSEIKKAKRLLKEYKEREE